MAAIRASSSLSVSSRPPGGLSPPRNELPLLVGRGLWCVCSTVYRKSERSETYLTCKALVSTSHAAECGFTAPQGAGQGNSGVADLDGQAAPRRVVVFIELILDVSR